MGVDYKEIGKRVKKARRDKGITQEKLAEMIEISVPHMSNIETGKTRLSFLLLFELVVALDVTADMLLTGRVSERDKQHSVVLKEVDEILSDCSDRQADLILDAVRNTKVTLTQYKTD